MDVEVNRWVLLGGNAGETEVRGQAWQGLGEASLERSVTCSLFGVHVRLLLLVVEFRCMGIVAYAKLVGQLVSSQEERIPGALKYKWATGYSTAHGTVGVKLPEESIATISPPSPEERKRLEEQRRAKTENARFERVINKAKVGALA